MDETESIAERFEVNRPHLRAVAYRMLGSLSEADDAVQEAWLRLNRSGASGVDNLRGWLTTVVARVCLDMLRARTSRREEPLPEEPSPSLKRAAPNDPEQEALMADSVGLALLVVLEMLEPAERLAFVMHDMFDIPFDEIASIVGRSPAAARQLASRARRRIHGGSPDVGELGRQRTVVDAFLAALREGNFEALLEVLDPDVVVRADRQVLPEGAAADIRGAHAAARQAIALSRGAAAARPALVDGAVGVVVAPRGRLRLVLRLEFAGEQIARIDVLADPERLAHVDLAVLSER